MGKLVSGKPRTLKFTELPAKWLQHRPAGRLGVPESCGRGEGEGVASRAAWRLAACLQPWMGDAGEPGEVGSLWGCQPSFGSKSKRPDGYHHCETLVWPGLWDGGTGGSPRWRGRWKRRAAVRAGFPSVGFYRGGGWSVTSFAAILHE